MVNTIFLSLCAIAALTMSIYYLTRFKRFKTLFFGTFTGITALLLLNSFGGGFGAALPLNIFNVCGSVVLGVPFLICAIVFNFL